MWAFPWFKTLVYMAGAGTSVKPNLRSATSIYLEKKGIPLDIALHQSKTHHPEAGTFRVTPPKDSTDIINVVVQQKEGAYFEIHNLQFDQYSGRLLKARSHEDKNLGEKPSQGKYDIHTGKILGFPGKILVFIASLVSASLPVTGFILWYGRAKKEKRKAKKSAEKRIQRTEASKKTLE